MKKGKLPLWILGYVAVILAIAVVINFAMGLAIPTNASLNGPTWLGFWGSYLGGAIGCIPAIAAFVHSVGESKHQHEELKTDRRLATMPVFSCRSNFLDFELGDKKVLSSLYALVFLNQSTGFHDMFSFSDPKYYIEKVKNVTPPHLYIFFELHNIGSGPALNVSMSCPNIVISHSVPLNSVGAGETRTILMGVHIPQEANDNYLFQYEIMVSFMDIFGNTYTQSQPLKVRKGTYSIVPISIPVLNN